MDKLKAGVTETQFNEWKARYGFVYEFAIPINDTGDKVYGYFRKPDLSIIAAATKFAESDPIKSGEVMFDNCFLGGDPIIKSNDECKLSAIQSLSNLFQIRAAEIKNL